MKSFFKRLSLAAALLTPALFLGCTEEPAPVTPAPADSGPAKVPDTTKPPVDPAVTPSIPGDTKPVDPADKPPGDKPVDPADKPPPVDKPVDPADKPPGDKPADPADKPADPKA